MPLACNAWVLAVPIAEAAIDFDRNDVLETAVLPIAPTPCILGGKPAAIGVRRDAEAASLDDGLAGPARPVPTPPTKELAVGFAGALPVALAATLAAAMAVCEIVRLRNGFTVETRSVMDSVIAPTASVAVEGLSETGTGGDAIAVTGAALERFDAELKNDKLD